MTRSAGPRRSHEPPAVLLEGGSERGERAVQPPARGAAERADAGRLLVEHVHADDRRAAFERGVQGRMVGDPEVVAEPDDRRCVAHARRP
jgi:hypothetical protein